MRFSALELEAHMTLHHSPDYSYASLCPMFNEWVSDCCLMPTLYHGENKLIFNEMMMSTTLY
jgi:hypothetical protein